MLHFALIFLQFFCAVMISTLVLLQRGKGAEAGAGFGAGASGTVFGARGAGTALSRATAIFTAVFMLNSLALAYVGERTAAAPKTIFDTAGQIAPQPAKPAAPLPGAPAPGAGTLAEPQSAGRASAPAASPSTQARPAPGSVPAPAAPGGK